MCQKILFVDDEEKILLSLKRLFRTSEYKIHFVTSGKEGLEFLRKESVSVIVSDMKMPEMNGVEFLVEAMKICPDAVRIILSGYAESGKIMDAVNNGHIWRFIPKPWNNDELRISIKNAQDLYKREKERIDLTERLKEKTIELDSLNKLLEKKVEERTWHLNERTRLLNLLLEDADIKIIIRDCCSDISKLLDNTPVYVKSLFHEGFFVSGRKLIQDVPSEVYNIEKKSLNEPGVISAGDYTAFELKKADTRLGTLVIKKNKFVVSENLEEKIAGYTSLIDIALFQFKSLEAAPELIKNIDKIMGSI